MSIHTRVRDPDTVQEPDPAMGSLVEAMDADSAPIGAKPDVPRLQGLQSRTLENRTRLADRYHQMPLYGEARTQADKGKARWKLTGKPSDHPLVQTILALRLDEDELMALPAEEIEAKERHKLRLAIKSKITDLLLALQKENDRIYDEVQEIILLDQRQVEHAAKMSIASGKSDSDLSDDQIAAKAKRLGITLNGDTP